MKSVPISEFKAKCLSLVDDVRRTGEPLEVTKRGKAVAIVSATTDDSIDWEPGAFRDQTRILGSIECDLVDLGISWDPQL